MIDAGLIKNNINHIEREIQDGNDEVLTYPYVIQFSAEHRCNLRCVMCIATAKRKRGKRPMMDIDMPDRTLERFMRLEPYIRYWETVSLTGSGEPLLSQALPSILEVLSRYHVKSILNTNAMLLDRAKADVLVKYRLHSVTISVDAATKETYEKIRVGAKWEKLIKAMETLNRVKDEYDSKLPVMGVSGNFMRQNISELPALIDFAAANRASFVLATNTEIYDPDMTDQALVHYPELVEKMVRSAANRALRRGIHFDNRIMEIETERSTAYSLFESFKNKTTKIMTLIEDGRYRELLHLILLFGRRRFALKGHIGEDNAPSLAIGTDVPDENDRSDKTLTGQSGRSGRILAACQMPWKGLMVASNGGVKVCCYDSPIIGNLDTSSLEEIWNGREARALRRSFIDNCPPEGCRRCFIFLKERKESDLFIKTIP